jgi:hypothetical protein
MGSTSALTNAQGAPHTEQAIGIIGRGDSASSLDRESICLIEIERWAISIVTRRVRLTTISPLKIKPDIQKASPLLAWPRLFGLQGTLKNSSIPHQISKRAPLSAN